MSLTGSKSRRVGGGHAPVAASGTAPGTARPFLSTQIGSINLPSRSGTAKARKLCLSAMLCELSIMKSRSILETTFSLSSLRKRAVTTGDSGITGRSRHPEATMKTTPPARRAHVDLAEDMIDPVSIGPDVYGARLAWLHALRPRRQGPRRARAHG